MDLDAGRACRRRTRCSSYTTEPQLRTGLHANPSDAVRYMEMNLANPPFDDVHVRKRR